MGLNTFFCSELSRGVSEKSIGTASIGQVWILLEYPFAWGTHALDDSNLPLPVKKHLKRALKSITHAKLLFIKQERARLSERALFVVRCRESKPFIQRFTLDDYNQLTEIDFAAVASGKLSADENLSHDPLFLVCTHGRRDKCCAKFGYPLYKSLSAGGTASSVWQSSHVGGDRFAANLLCFPHGLFYAHVTEEIGRVILKEYEAERITLENYRGRACYSNAVQAAEFFVRTESGVREIAELHRLFSAHIAEASWQVRFLETTTGNVHTVQVSRVMSDFQNLITCHATEARSVPQFQLDNYEVLEP
jgi:hypothetical protein